MRAIKVFSIFSLCLIIIFGSPGTLSSAAAQQQEKRVALVIGNGAYAKGPLATTANDAGLVAQNLQAAGFDVIGARDLARISHIFEHIGAPESAKVVVVQRL